MVSKQKNEERRDEWKVAVTFLVVSWLHWVYLNPAPIFTADVFAIASSMVVGGLVTAGFAWGAGWNVDFSPGGSAQDDSIKTE